MINQLLKSFNTFAGCFIRYDLIHKDTTDYIKDNETFIYLIATNGGPRLWCGGHDDRGTLFHNLKLTVNKLNKNLKNNKFKILPLIKNYEYILMSIKEQLKYIKKM